MLKYHFKDGRTVKLDLEDEEQARQWLELQRDPNFQVGLTALTISHRGVQLSIPRPRAFRSVVFGAEFVAPDPDSRNKGGERIYCMADDVRVTLMSHLGQRAARVTLVKTGKQRYNPDTDRKRS